MCKIIFIIIGIKKLVTCALSHVFELFGGFMPTNGFCNKKSKKLKNSDRTNPASGCSKVAYFSLNETPHVAPKIKIL
jgi:hypothetical protein